MERTRSTLILMDDFPADGGVDGRRGGLQSSDRRDNWRSVGELADEAILRLHLQPRRQCEKPCERQDETAEEVRSVVGEGVVPEHRSPGMLYRVVRFLLFGRWP